MSAGGIATGVPGQAARLALRPRRQKKRRKRFIVCVLVMVVALGYMIYSAMANGSEYYLTVSEVYALGEQAQQSQIKIGGKVDAGSIVWDRAISGVNFNISDEKGKTMAIAYRGVVPDSFQPGAEVILEGRVMQDGSFAATTLLAKCASKYESQLPGVDR